MESFVIELSQEEEELRKLIEPLLDSEGFDLVRLCLKRAHAKSLLSIYADTKEKLNGITISNLEFISRFLSDVLDAVPEDSAVLKANYELEVSSPGLDRPLTKVSHFKNALLKRVKVKLKNPSEIGTRTIYGNLLEAHDDAVILDVEGKIKEPLKLLYENIAEAHIIFDFPSKNSPKKRKSS